MTRSATGDLYTISSAGGGGVVAVISRVGAGIHALRHAGRDLTEPNPLSSMPPSSNGAILVPWPNRIRDGRWSLDGAPQQLALSDPVRHNATHGLLAQTEYALTRLGEDSVALAATVYPRKGYPFLLDTGVEYRVDDGGLTVVHTIVNAGEASAPVAIGAHPYLRVGDVPTADLVFHSGYRTRLEVDDQLIPVGEVPVAGTQFDASSGLRVGDMAFDHAFTGIPVTDGIVEHTVTAPDGESVRLWADEQFGYVQVYSPHEFPGADGPCTAIAVEPMTAPADAFNSGVGVRWLSPDETWTATWGIGHRRGE